MVMTKAKTAPKRPANLGEGFRRANRTTGGFLDDKHFEITDAVLIVDEFQGKNFKTGEPETVKQCNLKITFDIEGTPDPVERNYSCGKLAAPYDEDGIEQTEVGSEGIFIGGKEGKPFRGLSSQCAASIFLDKLADLGGYSEDKLVAEGTREALVGVSGTLMEYVVPINPKDKNPIKDRKPVPIASSIETSAGGAAPLKVSGAAAAASAAPVKKAADIAKAPVAAKPKARVIEPVEDELEEAAEEEPAAEEAAEDGDDLEATVTALVAKLVKKAPLTKVKLSQEVGKAFEKADADNKMPAVKLALSDAFLKAGAKAGEWQFDGRQIAAAE